MSMKRWMGLALVLAVALAGCKKKEENQQPAAQPTTAQPGQPSQPGQPGQPAQPAQPATGTTTAVQPTAAGTTPAPSAAETAEVLKALDGSVDKLSAGFGGALGGLMAKRAEAATPAGTTEPAPAGEQELPPPIQRIQIHGDLAAAKASPLGGMIEAAMTMIKSQADENAACLVDLLGKINTGFADITMGPDGEPSSFLMSIKSTATKDEVVNCMKGMADEGETFVEVPVGNRTGWTMRDGDEPVKVVMVEATPGNFLFGMPATLEAAIGGADPETDATFQALTAPLGPAFVRMAIQFKPEFAQLAETVAADAPPQAQCLRNVFGRTKGASMGIRLTPDFSLALAVQNGSPTEAAETQACLNGLWQMFKPALLQEVGAADAAQMQQLVGMTPAQFLDLIKIEAAAEFAKISLSLPGDFLAKVAQVVAAMAGAMGPGGPGAAGPGATP